MKTGVLRLLKLPGILPLRLFYGLKVSGTGNQMPRGRFILAANHGSMLDPMLLNIALPWRRIYALTAPQLFRCPRPLQAALRFFGAVPSRGPALDVETMESLARASAPKDVFAYFATGEITRTAAGFRQGAAVLALQTGLPLIPAYIQAAPFYKGGSRVLLGKAIPVQKKPDFQTSDAQALTQELHQEVLTLSTGIPQ